MKKIITMILSVSVCVLGLFFLYKQNNKNNTPELIKIENRLFVLTNQPSSIEETKKELGSISKKIDRFTIPKENFESNSLPEGSLIFSVKTERDFPKTVIYKKNNKLYIATEKDSPN